MLGIDFVWKTSTHLKISSRMPWVGFQKEEQKFSTWGDKRIKDTLIIFTHEWRASKYSWGEKSQRKIKWFWDLRHLFLQGAHLFLVLKEMGGTEVGTLQVAAVDAAKRPSRPTRETSFYLDVRVQRVTAFYSCCTCMRWQLLPCKLQG